MQSKFQRQWLYSCFAAAVLAGLAGYSVIMTAVFIAIYLIGVVLIGPEDEADGEYGTTGSLRDGGRAVGLHTIAYLKPPWFTVKVFNRIAMLTGIAGTETLTLTTRSGRSQMVPVITVDVDGTEYLVSTHGESQWVRNLRANPRLTLTRKGSSRGLTASEIPVESRPPIVEAYRAKAGRTVDGYFSALPDVADHPVFELTS